MKRNLLSVISLALSFLFFNISLCDEEPTSKATNNNKNLTHPLIHSDLKEKNHEKWMKNTTVITKNNSKDENNSIYKLSENISHLRLQRSRGVGTQYISESVQVKKMENYIKYLSGKKEKLEEIKKKLNDLKEIVGKSFSDLISSSNSAEMRMQGFLNTEGYMLRLNKFMNTIKSKLDEISKWNMINYFIYYNILNHNDGLLEYIAEATGIADTARHKYGDGVKVLKEALDLFSENKGLCQNFFDYLYFYVQQIVHIKNKNPKAVTTTIDDDIFKYINSFINANKHNFGVYKNFIDYVDPLFRLHEKSIIVKPRNRGIEHVKLFSTNKIDYEEDVNGNQYYTIMILSSILNVSLICTLIYFFWKKKQFE